jgi:hypothetical protein
MAARSGQSGLGAEQQRLVVRLYVRDTRQSPHSFRVANFDEWRPGYDSAVERTIGIKSVQVWRGQDDPDLVAVA